MSEAAELIDLLRLNDGPTLEFRRLWIEIVRMAKHHELSLYGKLVGFPDDLPDLKTLRPPGGNIRPDGVEQSHRARQERNDLPETY